MRVQPAIHGLSDRVSVLDPGYRQAQATLVQRRTLDRVAATQRAGGASG